MTQDRSQTPPPVDLSSLPKSLEPQRDLWPDIARNLAPRAAPSAPASQAAGPPARVLRWRIAAALALPAAAAALALWWVRPAVVSPVASVDAPAPAALPAPGGGDDLAQAFEAYRAAAAQLERAIRTRSDNLPPDTRAVLEDNLQVIDGALKRLETALQAHPADPALVGMALQMWRSKLALLEQTLLLATSKT